MVVAAAVTLPKSPPVEVENEHAYYAITILTQCRDDVVGEAGARVFFFFITLLLFYFVLLFFEKNV